MNYSIEAVKAIGGEAGLVFEVKGLYQALVEVTDRRNRRGVRYSLAVILTLLVLAKLAGEDELAGIAEWVRLRQRQLVEALGLKREQVPHQTTYRRVLEKGVDVDEFERVIGLFFAAQGSVEQIALDGKTMRGTIEQGQTQGVHLLAAYVPAVGVVLRQAQTDRHENELTVAPDLIASLNLAGVVVTGDALFTQQNVSRQILEAGGHYVWLVKDNQPTLRQDIERLFAPEFCLPGTNQLKADFLTTRQIDKAHGRLEQRILTTSSLLAAYLDWPGLQQVFKLERHTTYLKTGKRTCETFYGLSSLPAQEASPARLLQLRRQHWCIENRLHYCRDVSLHEDQSRLRCGQTPHVLAILNNLTLGLLRLAGFQRIPSARRYFDAHPLHALYLLGYPFT
jgi:predicted transposase YbfD/YdcC